MTEYVIIIQEKTMECAKLFAVWGLLFFASLHYISGKYVGSVVITLHTLENPGNTDYEGKCCNGSSCRSCDYQLWIWVTCDGKTSDTDCLYGMGKTGLFYNASGISFNQDLGNGLRNHLVYNFTSFQGNLGIRILASDQVGAKIHDYKLHQPHYPKTYAKRNWTDAILPATIGPSTSRIELAYQVYCKEHYYSPSCTVGCVPGANYRCDEGTGRKLCNAGWLGPNCTCDTGNRKYNCDISTGKRLCYPPWFGEKCDVKCQARNDWFSNYTCDSSGSKVCRRGWYGNECNETTPAQPQVSSLASSTLKTQQKNLVSLTIAAKNSMISLRMTSSPITSPVTSSFMTSSHMTSSMTSLSTTSLMTSSIITSRFVMSSESHLLTSYVFSTHIEGGSISRPKGTSMTIRNFAGQTENSYSQTTIFTTSYLSSRKPISLHAGFTKRLPRTTVDITGTLEATKDRTEIIRDRTEITRDLSGTTKEHAGVSKDRTRWISRDKTHQFEHHTKRSEFAPVITSTVIHDHETSCSTCDGITITATPSDTEATITLTTRDTEATILPIPRDTEATILPTTRETEATILPTTRDTEATILPTPRDTEATILPTPRDTEATILPTPRDTEATILPTPRDTEATILPTPRDTEATISPTCDTEAIISPTPRDTEATISPTPRNTEATISPTPRDITFEPASKDARKTQDVWWQILVAFIVAILLIVAGIVVYKMKNRKHHKVSPHYETSMQEFKVKSNHHDEQNTRNISKQKHDRSSGQEDLEAIWKVMSTCHE